MTTTFCQPSANGMPNSGKQQQFCCEFEQLPTPDQAGLRPPHGPCCRLVLVSARLGSSLDLTPPHPHHYHHPHDRPPSPCLSAPYSSHWSNPANSTQSPYFPHSFSSPNSTHPTNWSRRRPFGSSPAVASLFKLPLFFAVILTSLIVLPIHAYDYDTITRQINPGDKMDIPCSMVSPGGSVQWVLNNKPILLDFSQNQRRHWNISNDGHASLTISRATKMDEGLWECWELDSHGNVRQKAPIMKIVLSNIPEEPYLEYDGRRLSSYSAGHTGGHSVPSAAITVRENTMVSLNCVIKGLSSPVRSVQWYVAEQNVTEQSKLLMEYSVEEDISLTISVLSLNVSAELHTSLVQCQIHHPSWPTTATISASLNVLYAPQFSILREPGFGYPIIEGMPLSLKCDIDANPPSQAKWERDPDPSMTSMTSLPPISTYPEGYLNFSIISKQDIGWYRCTTQHEFGFFASFGYFLNVRSGDELPQLATDILGGANPHLSDSSQDPSKTAKDSLGRETQFQASVANGPDTLASRHNLHHHSSHPYPEQGPPYGRPSSSSSSGKSCVSELENGRPIIESINSTVIALVGSQITLIARFCCNPRPRKVYWIHRHLAMMPSRIIGRYITRELVMTSNSMNCFTSSFIIDSVKAEDAGDIMFVVLNQKGIDNSLVSVNVTFASHSIAPSLAGNGSLSQLSNPNGTVFNLLMLLSMLAIFVYHHFDRPCCLL